MKLKTLFLNFILYFTSFFSACALANPPRSIGAVSSSLTEVAFGVHGIVQAMFLIASFAMIMGAVYQYRKYRINSIENRFSTVIMLIIFGIMFLILAFIPMTIFD
jgi:hypothetical protein